VSRYQKGKTNLDLLEQEIVSTEQQWHHLGHMQICTSPQTDNHTSTLPLKFFFTVWMRFMQHQGIKGNIKGMLCKCVNICTKY